MKKNIFITLFCVILTLTCVFCGIGNNLSVNSVKIPVNNAEILTQPPTVSPTIVINSKEPLTLEKGSAKVIALTESEEKTLEKWTSSDEKVVSIDSGGRVDALQTGSATVTAIFSDNKKSECKITVVDAEKSEYDGFSTCILANTDILLKNKKNSDKNLYSIHVNRKMNCVTVYTYDNDGNYTVPVRAMVCSCGKNDSTITGEFGIYFKNEWHALYQGVYGHYVSGISGDYLFHSVPYYTPFADDLEVDEFNKLGTDASLGCVRLAIADTKWIYDNCPYDTEILIYDDNNPGPLGKPEAIRITDKSCGWDPTDNNSKNPYLKKTPKITGAEDCTFKKGGSFYPLGGITAVDTCSNDITDKISVIGNVVTSREGTYKVTYSVTDAMHRTATKDITVTVK